MDIEDFLEDRIFDTALVLSCARFLECHHCPIPAVVITEESLKISCSLAKLGYDSRVTIGGFYNGMCSLATTNGLSEESRKCIENMEDSCAKIRFILHQSVSVFAKPASALYRCTMATTACCSTISRGILEFVETHN